MPNLTQASTNIDLRSAILASDQYFIDMNLDSRHVQSLSPVGMSTFSTPDVIVRAVSIKNTIRIVDIARALQSQYVCLHVSGTKSTYTKPRAKTPRTKILDRHFKWSLRTSRS